MRVCRGGTCVKVLPLMFFVLGLVFTVFGTGFAHDGNDFDLYQLLLGLLQMVLAAAMMGWIPMPSGPAPEVEEEDSRNKH